MRNRKKSIPHPPEEWEETAGFRETLLQYFTEPAQDAALRTLSEILHEHAMQCSDWYKGTGSVVWHEMGAVEKDMRHLTGYLLHVASERGASELSHDEYKLATLAARVAGKLEVLANRIARGRERAGDAMPDDEPPPTPSLPPCAAAALPAHRPARRALPPAPAGN